jgi:general secretion pathway protein K
MKARRQRGVAILMVMVIVALATILATQIGFDSVLEQRRSAAVLTMDQAFEIGLGAEAWAASYLKKDFDDDPKVDHPAERWATPIPPIPIDGGKIEGQLSDLQGRFNVNNLVDANGVRNPEAMRQFKNLLSELQLEPKWAGILADWLDADTQPDFPDGGEDNVYTSQTPPYRTANGPITSVSELLALPEFGLERYLKLRPFITALPVGSKINVCTAPGMVIDALNDGTLEYGVDAESLARSRQQHCFPTLSDIQGAFSADAWRMAQPSMAETSEYFQLAAIVTIGTTEYSLYSLLQRDPSNGLVRPVMRSFGAE